MRSKISIGKYYERDSILHRIHPFAKLIGLLVWVILTFFLKMWYQFFLCGILLFCFLLLSLIPFRLFGKMIYSMRILLLSILILYLLLGISFSSIGMTLCRLLFVVLMTTLFTLTTKPTEITYALERLFLPLTIFHLPIHRFAFSISLSLRFIPTIMDQADKILKSQASRGADFYDKKIKGKMQIIYSILSPMFLLSFDHAGQLAETMEVRLYDLDQARTYTGVGTMKRQDWMIIMVSVLLLICLFGMEVWL